MAVSKTLKGLTWTNMFKKFEIEIEGDFEYLVHDRFIYIGRNMDYNGTEISVYDIKKGYLIDKRSYDYYFGGFYLVETLVKVKLYDYKTDGWYTARLSGTAGLCGFDVLK